MKTIPNTVGGWACWVEKVKELKKESGNDYPLQYDDYSIMMREYYILGKKPEQFVNMDK